MTDRERGDTETLEQAARILREWSGHRQQQSGRWTAREQAAIDCAIRLEALASRAAQGETPPQEPVDNGNTFVFCDYVSRDYKGCIRGAGHNGPHVFAHDYDLPKGPVLCESSVASE